MLNTHGPNNCSRNSLQNSCHNQNPYRPSEAQHKSRPQQRSKATHKTGSSRLKMVYNEQPQCKSVPAVQPTIGEAAMSPAAYMARRMDTVDCTELGSTPARS
jgi:hypothetical protein